MRRWGLLCLIALASACGTAGRRGGLDAKQKELGQRALFELRVGLSAPEADLRVRAALAFGTVGNPAAGPALHELLRDPEPQVVAAAAWALWKLGDEGGAGSLEAIAKEDPGPAPKDSAGRAQLAAKNRARALAVKTLAQVEGERSADLLEGLLSDDYGEVRDAAGIALLRFNRQVDRTMNYVLKAAASEKPAERALAARALGAAEAPGALPVLKQLAADADLEVRLEALDALGGRGDVTTLPELLGALKDGNPAVELRAARALSRVRSRSAAPALRELLERPLPLGLYGWVGLKRLKLAAEPFVPGRAAGAKDPGLREEAAEALEWGGPEGLDTLGRLLDDDDPKVRLRAAASALAVLERRGS